MQKKTLLIVALILIVAGLAIYPRLSQSSAGNSRGVIGVSEVSAAPNDYLGKLTITGDAGAIYEEESVIIIVDGGGCCTIPLLVPFTTEQQTILETASLYTGTLPAEGESLQVSGTLSKVDAYYVFDVDEIIASGKVIITKVK
ncbi:MAG: hypothetical protein KGZ63_06115 [Clostridiales bacterium]|jgi:hypothetical protein|nr:hypothetical protein [Clostridiales bacterium]